MNEKKLEELLGKLEVMTETAEALIQITKLMKDRLERNERRVENCETAIEQTLEALGDVELLTIQ